MAARHEHRLYWKRLLAVSRSARWVVAEVAIVLLLWEFAGRIMQFRPSILPTPSRILLEVWRQAPVLQQHGQATFEEIMAGLLLAIALATPFAYLVALFPRIQPFVAPLLLLIRRAPLLALAPVLLVWFSFGMLPKTLVVLLMAFFPTAEGILAGLRSIPEEMIDLLRTMRAGSLQILFKVQIPGSLPGFLEGLKIAIRLAVSGAIVAEFVAADQGLGYLMLSGISKMEVPLVFAALTVLTGFGLAFYVLVILLERMLIPWHVEIADRKGVCFGRYA